MFPPFCSPERILFMKFSPFEHPRTARSRDTRLCIGQTMIRLMDETSFDDIRVTDIVREAGVSRMTYYKYYTSKLDVLKDYLQEMILEYDRERKQKFPGTFFTYDQLLHCIRYFLRYRSVFQILSRTSQYSLIATSINQYISCSMLPESQMDEYAMYYYCGAIVGIFFRWMSNGRPASPEALAQEFCRLSGLPGKNDGSFDMPTWEESPLETR